MWRGILKIFSSFWELNKAQATNNHHDESTEVAGEEARSSLASGHLCYVYVHVCTHISPPVHYHTLSLLHRPRELWRTQTRSGWPKNVLYKERVVTLPRTSHTCTRKYVCVHVLHAGPHGHGRRRRCFCSYGAVMTGALSDLFDKYCPIMN